MNKVYLLCTRAAIMASAGTYVINSSPDFYGIVHNNLWMEETSEDFGLAKIINDWWNVSDKFKNTGYNADFRNNNTMEEQDLVRVCEAWNNMGTGKNICLFTHATNVEDIVEIRNRLDLPMVVITTSMGQHSDKFIDPILRREYNPLMNDYAGLDAAWEHIYNQLIILDEFWKRHGDFNITINDWLSHPQELYHTLGVAYNHNVNKWTEQFVLWNNAEDLEMTSIMYSKTDAYKVQLLTYLFNTYSQDIENTSDKIKFANILMEVYKENDWFEFDEFMDAAFKKLGYNLTSI